MGAPMGNRNAAGKHSGSGGKKTKYGKVGSKSWAKKVNAHASKNRITGKTKGKRGRYSYSKYY
jgi:hypothetical protein